MKSFSIYQNREDDSLEVITTGLSFYAFIFGVLWAAYYRLWYVVLAFALLLFAAPYMNFQATDLGMIFSIILAFLGSEIREFFLLRKGYKFGGVIYANSAEEAEIQYYSYKDKEVWEG